MEIEIQKYSPEKIEETVALLAAAFVTNPLHLCVFGAQRLDQNRLFFRIGLRRMFIGTAFVAMSDGAVRGYMHFNLSPYCLPAPEEIPAAVATLLKPLGGAQPQLVAWLSRWCRLDPDEPHIHLGPIGVSPEAQGRGFGTALMQRYVENLDEERAAGYLETDREENVEFYKKFGFLVRHQEVLIGTPVWYMWRPQDLNPMNGA